jgi:hypothetical protein
MRWEGVLRSGKMWNGSVVVAVAVLPLRLDERGRFVRMRHYALEY